LSAPLELAALKRLSPGLTRLRASRLLRQNLVLFVGGLTAGVGGFVYHAVAGRLLGPERYGEVASLVALYTVGTTANLILILVLARYAADLCAQGRQGALRHIALRTTALITPPSVALWVLVALFGGAEAAFLHLDSPVPLLWLALAVVACLFMAVPRGVLQGTQRFGPLSANMSLELVVRTGSLVALLAGGLAVTGSMVAIVLGCGFAYCLGMLSMRDVLRLDTEHPRMRVMAGFAATAAAGTLGVILLYNVDVVLAKHYLSPHDAGIYGGLNKIATILYYLTLSVSQVLFPRVVEAIQTGRPPARLLAMSGGLIALLGVAVIAFFGAFPGLVVRGLFGPSFEDAQPYVLAVGFIGLAISLDNLLVQFFMAVHDRFFVPILGGACVLMPALIVLFHTGVAQVVADVTVTAYLLLAALLLRCALLMPRLRPEALGAP
jgi:O-antigen/teichoic acid export membrane protein